MLIPNQTFKIKMTPKASEYYAKKGYDVFAGNIIDVKLEDLPMYGIYNVRYICDYCKEEKYKTLSNYNHCLIHSKIKKDACKLCGHFKRRESNGELFTDEKLRNIFYEKMRIDEVKLKLSERELEDIIVNNISLVEKGMEVIKRQVEIEDGRLDVLARDRNGKLCIIELKAVPDCKDLIFQAAYYPTQFKEEVRMITIAPGYSEKLLLALRNTNNGNVEIKSYLYANDSLSIHSYIEKRIKISA